MTASPLVTRTGLAQLLALAGLGGAFALGGVEPPAALAAPACAAEDQCTFKRPVLMFILDYSTSMNAPLGEGLSRWEAAVASVQSLVAADNSFVASNMLVGLLRFGHDPDPEAPGTAIPGDASGLVDGQAVDVVWFDEQHAYKPCDGAALIDALAAAPAPLDGASEGIGTWTDGALQRSRALLVESLASHPEDAPSQDDRRYLQLVLTDGEWTDPDGVGQSPAHDPAATAAALWDDGVGDPDDPTHVLTYVVYFGELQGAGEAAAGQLAAAGGSGEALLAADPQALTVAIHDVIAEIQDSVSTPDCTAGLPRIMVLVDASSSMLNDGESGVALPGLSGWDQARFAIAGDPSGQNLSLFERELEPGVTVADYVHVGLAVFGTDEPAEERILFQYGPCRQDNAYWAMAPEVSHGDCPKIDYTPLLYAPATPIRSLIDACDLPWKGPPILWSSPSVVAGAPGPEDDPPGPGFDDETHAHMPRCDLTADFELPICVGSGTFTHRGLELIRANQEAYHLDAVGKGEANDDTQYVNILITDGQYAGFSTDYQVSSQLKAMAEDGIRTFVVAFGSGLQSSEAQLQLLQMAQWGDTEKPYYADSQVQLETVLADIVLALDFDPCCQFNDCSENPEPTGGDPDPAGECQGDADCPPLEFCDGAPIGQCAPRPCDADGDCSAGPPAVCDGGVCTPGPCARDEECPGGQVCEDGDCVASGACEDDSHCAVTEECHEGACRPRPCEAEFDCAWGFVCDPVDQVCVPYEPTDTSGEPETGEPVDTATTTGYVDDAGGCGCATTSTPGGVAWLLSLIALGRRSRRRDPAHGRAREPRSPARGRALQEVRGRELSTDSLERRRPL